MKLDLPGPKRVVALFVLIGSAWIFLSSGLVYFFGGPAGFTAVELLKGLAFVLLTGAFLFYLLLHYEKKVKNTVRAWERSKANFRKLYEDSPQPMWISCDVRGVLFMNKAAVRLFGYGPEQVPALPEEILSPEGVRQFIGRSGEQLYLDMKMQLIEYEQQPARLVIANDVTPLVEAEKERGHIHKELTHYKKALDRSALLSVTDSAGKILDVNSKFCEVSKYTREELIGSTHSLLASSIHSPSFFRRLYGSVQKGEVWRGEVCMQAKDESLFWVDLSVIPMRNEANEVIKYMAISYPVTDRKVAELKSEKIHQELMTFMYKASHNLRGPVATLSGLLNVAFIEVKDEASLGYIRMLSERTKHLEFVLNELIAITKIKQEELSVAPVSFPSLVKQVCSQFEEDIRRAGICVECSVRIDGAFTNDEKLLRALLFYLVDNAVKFRNNREPRIQIQLREQLNGVALTVADNGPGISEAIRERIYEMYFRGHEKSTGSGLGLYIVNSIVERLGGYIQLQSQPGLGSTFTVYLPDAAYLKKQRKENSKLYLREQKARRAKTGS